MHGSPIVLLTVFIQIVATTTINFSLAGVQLLIKGGSYQGRLLLILGQYLPVPSVTQSTGF